MANVYAIYSSPSSNITFASNAAFAMGDVWTIEFWYRQVNAGNGAGRVLSNAAYTGNYHELYFDVVGQIRLASGIGYTVMSTGFANNTNAGWTHYAFVCNGSNVSTYRNGTLFDTNNALPEPYGHFNAITAFQFLVNTNAYYRFFRISNNVRYSGNFTAPNNPFSTDGNTVLLMNGDTGTFSELTGKSILSNTTSQAIVDDTNLPAESNPPPVPPTSVIGKVLVVAGGGGGGGYGGAGNGGGGAGGYIYTTSQSLTLGNSYNVVIGQGGAKGVHSANSSGQNGTNSVFGPLTAIGGGAGAGLGTSGQSYTGASGGSGGGANGQTTIGRSGGTGTVGQGNNGGSNLTGFPYTGGGGGGATGAGQNGSAGGAGGPGFTTDISGVSVTYAIGGQAGSALGDPGSNNTAPGSGGNGNWPGLNGIVIISYPSAGLLDGTGGTITHVGGNTIHTFTASGTFIAPTFVSKSIKTTAGKILRSSTTQNIIRNAA